MFHVEQLPRSLHRGQAKKKTTGLHEIVFVSGCLHYPASLPVADAINFLRRHEYSISRFASVSPRGLGAGGAGGKRVAAC